MPSSPFLQAAQTLDETFDALEQTAGSLGRLEMTSETALDKARQLLERFSQRSLNLGEQLSALGRTLQERQDSLQLSIARVQEIAPVIQARLQEVQAMMDRFQALGLAMRDLTAEAQSLRPEQTAARLKELTEQAMALQEEAQKARLPGVQRGVQNLRKSLKAASAQLEKAL